MSRTPRPALDVAAALALAAATCVSRDARGGPCLVAPAPHVTAVAPLDHTAVSGGPGASVTFRWAVDWKALAGMCPGTAWKTHFEVGTGLISGNGFSTKVLDGGPDDPNNAASRAVTVKSLSDGMARAGVAAGTELGWLVLVRPASESFGGLAANGTFRIAAGPPHLVLIASPPSGWPAEFVVKNLGAGASEATLLRATVALQQADVDAVARNCSPRFVDFEDAVPALEAKTGLATIHVLTRIGPEALAAWNARNKPARGRPAAAPTPTPLPNPVQQMVACRYALTVTLGKNPGETALTSTIAEFVPAK